MEGSYIEIDFANLKIYDKRPISYREWNKLVDIVKRITLYPGSTYKLSRSAAGTVIITSAKGAAAATGTVPFTVTTAPIVDSTNLSVSVSAGTVNSLLPTNNFSTDFTIDPTDVNQVIVTATTDGAAVTSCALEVGTTVARAQEPTPFALPTTVDIVIAAIVGGIVYRVIGDGSIQLTGTPAFQTNPSEPSDPGNLPYIQYYTWTVGTV